MKLYKNRRAQSMIEYAILLAVVISAFLLLQAIVKRGVSGGINDAASRMGDQYSVSNSVIQETRAMAEGEDHIIVEEGGIDSSDDLMTDLIADAAADAGVADYDIVGAIDRGANSISSRVGHGYSTDTRQTTDSTIHEDHTSAEYEALDDEWDNPEALWE